ncbi:MAG: flagellar protein FliS [Sphingomonadaceae bacterium]|jgi:flagellar protein FliS
MIATADPREAYRKIEFDARVQGADGRHLVGLCYEELLGALDRAMRAAGAADNLGKSRALTQAISAITALQLGVSGEGDVVASLRHFYEGARRTLLDCAISFDGKAVTRLREDFAEIGAALKQA